jgi:hypothetical protein
MDSGWEPERTVGDKQAKDRTTLSGDCRSRWSGRVANRATPRPRDRVELNRIGSDRIGSVSSAVGARPARLAPDHRLIEAIDLTRVVWL